MKNFKQFFEQLEKKAVKIPFKEMLHYTIEHPKRVAGGLAGIALGAYAGPKAYYMLNESKKKEQQKINTDLLAKLLLSSQSTERAIVGEPKPKKNTYDQLIYY